MLGRPVATVLEQVATEKPSTGLFDLEFYEKNSASTQKNCVVFSCRANARHQFEVRNIVFSKYGIEKFRLDEQFSSARCEDQALNLSLTLNDFQNEKLRSLTNSFLLLYRQKVLVAAQPKLHSHNLSVKSNQVHKWAAFSKL